VGKYGLIYIAQNARDGENVFKVGKTERDIESRMTELTSSTSNLGSYKALSYFVVSNIDEAEYKCHTRLSQYRIQNNREFFEIKHDELLSIVEEEVRPYLATNVNSVPLKPEGTLYDNLSIEDRIKKRKEQTTENVREEIKNSEAKINASNAAAEIIYIHYVSALKELRKHLIKEFSDAQSIKILESEGESLADKHSHRKFEAINIMFYAISDTKNLLLFEKEMDKMSKSELDLMTELLENGDRKLLYHDEKRIVYTECDDHRIGELEITCYLAEAKENFSAKCYINIYFSNITYVNVISNDYSILNRNFNTFGMITGNVEFNINETIDLATTIISEYVENPSKNVRKIIKPINDILAPQIWHGPEVSQDVYIPRTMNIMMDEGKFKMYELSLIHI